MEGQLLGAAWTAGITVFIIFVAIVGVGFWLIARRKRRNPEPDALAQLQQRANILLVRVDDAIKSAEDELAFAQAQFGESKSQEFDEVLVTAKGQLKEAFRLQQKLDDSYQDTTTERRDWNGRIIHLCESARTALDAQSSAFAALRDLEQNAPKNLATVRTLLDASDTRIAAAAQTLKTLTSRFSTQALISVSDNIDFATRERDAAATKANLAQKVLDGASASAGVATADGASAGGASAAELIHAAGEHLFRAQNLIDAIEVLQGELTKTGDALTVLRDSTSRALAEARSVRDSPPDPDAGKAVGSAIQKVEAALAIDPEGKDPLATLETLRAANSELDTSLASARNQKQRLEGAKTALVGALVGAKSQLKATKIYMDNRRGGVGSAARTRLAEAERLLAVAEAETDPVIALDTARSSATYSRDADALARFDLSGR